MIKGIKHYISGYRQGRKRLPCHGKTIGYERGYRRGIRRSNLTSKEERLLLIAAGLSLLGSVILGGGAIFLYLFG